jgi:hypothetical protein
VGWAQNPAPHERLARYSAAWPRRVRWGLFGRRRLCGVDGLLAHSVGGMGWAENPRSQVEVERHVEFSVSSWILCAVITMCQVRFIRFSRSSMDGEKCGDVRFVSPS